MKLQADISNASVERPNELESTARGAAMLAGIGAGLFASGSEAAKMVKIERSFEVTMEESERRLRREAWQNAIRRARSTS